jgi:hypothetical protein
LGVALKSIAAAPGRALVEHAPDPAHEPSIGRDAFTVRSSLDAHLERLWKAERDPARELLPARHSDGVRSLIHDDHELRLATGETHLDPTGFELAADLESGLAEEVEKPEMERGTESLAQASSGLGGRLVSEAGGVRQILLDRLDVAIELHDDIIMTSLLMSVKQHLDEDVHAPERPH